ncbi:MAG: DNA-directed RNA polymerase subunit beta [Firmicutes bacterium]|nr:DNA-directed RNA polymerase subunit beta [Bacillota bacterium]
MSYSRIGEILDMPDLIEVQKNSYDWFLTKGLGEVFHDISQISDFSGNLILEFVDYSIDRVPKYSVEESKERDATYSSVLRAKVRLINKETGEVKEQEIFMGDFPLMTDHGTFIINGAERVIVSQLIRAPGIYYSTQMDKTGKPLFSNTLIPNRGAWLEYETDSNDVVSVRIDRTRKIPVTVILRALGLGRNEQIIEMFGGNELILSTIDKDIAKTREDGLVEIYKRLRPGEPPTVESAEALINSLFFDPRRYDLAKVGRYKFNKKLAIAARITGLITASDIVSPVTGEILAAAGEKLTKEKAELIEQNDVNEVTIDVDGTHIKVFSNKMVHLSNYVDFDITGLDIKERVYLPVLEEILSKHTTEHEIKEAIAENIDELVPRYIRPDDILSSVNYQVHLSYGIGTIDDIDHLGNRRLRSVGELLQNQFRIGLARMERVVRERMSIQDLDVITPQTLINIRPVSAAIKEFFGSSQLSQFMDQTNPLSELTHKRRLSALGPGGLSRERAGFEVRDVHHSHYGRMCPIESPEGPNIGLISSLSTYARVNEYGFIETPYRKVDKQTAKVMPDTVYMTADVEDDFIIAQANEPLDEQGKFINKRVSGRYQDKILEVDANQVDYMDASPKQMVSVATAMIPFLENDDANRALMGSNMQRQAVPLIKTDSPIVGTGMEYKAARDSGVVVIAKKGGVVQKVSSDEIQIKNEDGLLDTYKLLKFKRSNQSTCVNQKPTVLKGERVEQGEIIADGPSTQNGEIALGRNVLIGFMTWEGYNYEDAILISEKLVKDDTFTSIHIEKYECESRDTKLGPEEITREIPNVGEDSLQDLDERGIIRLGAEVAPGDILVGKITPKGETDLTSEERLLRAIFGEKAREVRDTSLRVPHGEAGIIVDVKIFTRQNGDELAPGVNQLVRCYIAQRRKISVGDKMAGRHGNKGVISRILPDEDMPFLPDGTPLDIVFNPLGVPSRMNIGQVLEVHLGYAAKALGWKISTPIFDGANEQDVMDALERAGHDRSGKSLLYDGRTGEPFDSKVTVGYMYILKLAHLVDDKIHARSTGPYSLVTQQPLGGKAQFGGQRFGEMEVWALEAYGAAYTLQEILTVKSDDVVGRVKTYESIVKGENIPQPGVPESFKVLIKELQSLCLNVKVLDENMEEVALRENADEEEDFAIKDLVLADTPGYESQQEAYLAKEKTNDDIVEEILKGSNVLPDDELEQDEDILLDDDNEVDDDFEDFDDDDDLEDIDDESEDDDEIF